MEQALTLFGAPLLSNLKEAVPLDLSAERALQDDQTPAFQKQRDRLHYTRERLSLLLLREASR